MNVPGAEAWREFSRERTEASFAPIYDATHRRVYAVCRMTLVNEEDALEAFQSAYARVVAAARFVGADEFIRRLPQGYGTVLAERGLGLSLGQRQLLAVARAIVRNPRILILDEATSALDAATEARLLANIRRAGKGRTVVLVTHRPAVIEACDRVLLLERGRLVLSGAPADVLARLRLPARAGLQAAG